MVRAKPRAAVLFFLSLALTAPACFAVDTVDPGGVVIDDFDDGDFVPRMHEFIYWTCYAFNPPTNRDYRCDHTEGLSSAYSLFVEFSVQDAPDGERDYPGAGLSTFSDVPVDFTPYRELVVGMRVRSGTPPVPSESRVYVELYCANVESESGSGPVSTFYVTQSVRPSDEWATFRLALANMAPPPWLTEKVKGGIPACLRAVDGISLSLSSQVQDGQAATGTFFIDGLSLQ
jgi:hypothetical protein